MKAVTIMFDSLNKNYLSPYGASDVITPNFQRLAEKTITFDKFYAGSLPCMPARREIHTGRYNFLIRSWSPLEPFDDSMPEILSSGGVCTQFVSDHCHYWQDGGLTYHQRYTCFDMVRGQEGDEWHARAKGYKDFPQKRLPRRQDEINREYTREDNSCHARCFESGKDFILNNLSEDDWYLHLEYFDPHEPFDAPKRYKDLYSKEDIKLDWPLYDKVDAQNEELVRQSILNYKASVTMCDDYLGRVLDLFDQHNLWEDTMLIVNTDHGFLLGEHGFMAKNYMPCYEEIVNLPFFIHDPRCKEKAGTRCDALSQTIDIAPTLLDFFGKEIPKSMMGNPLGEVVKTGKNHDAILFGYFGKHINVTDGTHVYMRRARDNQKLFEYTLMPTRLASIFHKDEIKNAQDTLTREFDYCDNVPMLKIPAHTKHVPQGSHHQYDGHLQFDDMLFDLTNDKKQEHNLVENQEIVKKMIRKMIKLMKDNEAPKEQFERMGLQKEEQCQN